MLDFHNLLFWDYRMVARIVALMTRVGGVWYSVVYPTALPLELVENSGSLHLFVPGRHMKRFLPIRLTSSFFRVFCLPNHCIGNAYVSASSLNLQKSALVTYGIPSWLDRKSVV